MGIGGEMDGKNIMESTHSCFCNLLGEIFGGEAGEVVKVVERKTTWE